MDIDEFLDKEASKMGGKAQIQENNAGVGKQSSENILDQLQTVKNQLRENRVDTALKEFDFLKSRYTDMTKKQLSENRYIFNELMRINQEIINKINSQRSDFEKRTQMIRKLLNDSQRRFGNGELQTAYKLYIEMTEIIKNMSDLFYEDKNRLNYEVMSFASQLFPKLQEQTDSAFEQKKNLLLHQITQAYQQLQTNNGELPPKVYENINNMFQQLPEGHIYEKAILYNDILKLFRSSSLSGEASSLVNEMLKQQSGFANSVLKDTQSQEPIPSPNMQGPSQSQQPNPQMQNPNPAQTQGQQMQSPNPAQTQDQQMQSPYEQAGQGNQTSFQQSEPSMQSPWQNQQQTNYPAGSEMAQEYIQKNPQEFPQDNSQKNQKNSPQDNSGENQTQKNQKKGLFTKLFNKNEKNAAKESNDNKKGGEHELSLE